MAPSVQERNSTASPIEIRVVSRRFVKASDPSIEHYILPMSNMDLIGNAIQCHMCCIYPKPTNGDFRAITQTFETYLPSFLNHFFPWAGRIVYKPASYLPEVHCLNQGVELVIGEVGVTLDSLDWTQTEASLHRILLPYDKDLPLSVQVLSFTCGGFAVLWGINCLLADGNTVMRLLTGWTELLRTSTIAGVRPDHAHYDRSRFFCPRDPPTYGAKVAEMFQSSEHEHMINALTMQDSSVERLYYVESHDIERIHKAACPDGHPRVSRVDAFSAYLWKVLAGLVAVSGHLSEEQKRCGLISWVDLRRRFSSPELRAALRGYLGNAISFVRRDEHATSILDKPLADVAVMVRETITSTESEELCRDFVDWMEVNKPAIIVEKPTIGLGNPTLAHTMWSSFTTDLDFGFGQASLTLLVEPTYSRPASGLMYVVAKPGGEGSGIVNAQIWRCLAEALEADEQHIFKPLTAEYLGLTYGKKGGQKISRL